MEWAGDQSRFQSIRDAHPYTPEVAKDNAADAAASQNDQPKQSSVLLSKPTVTFNSCEAFIPNKITATHMAKTGMRNIYS